MTVRTNQHGKVRVITIDRPEVRNAIDSATTRALAEAFDDAAADSGVWAVVLTGAGTKAFSAGQDLKEMAAGRGLSLEDADRSRGFTEVIEGNYRKPLLAAVNGPAVGGGLEMVLACDLAVAAEHATFGLPEVRQGLVAVAGGVVRLARRVPPAIALELILTGDPIEAKRALAIGLVNRVVPSNDVLDETFQLAERITECSPAAIAISKRLARGGFDLSASDWESIRSAMATLYAGPDAMEGALAFIEKRAPNWQPPVAG